jgi:hypothetical protein
MIHNPVSYAIPFFHIKLTRALPNKVVDGGIAALLLPFLSLLYISI